MADSKESTRQQESLKAEDQKDDELDELAPTPSNATDKTPASLLYEMCVKHRVTIPRFELVSDVGDAHLRMFTMSVSIPDMNLEVIGEGTTKSNAKHEAALRAFDKIQGAAELGVPLHNVPYSILLDCCQMLKVASIVRPNEDLITYPGVQRAAGFLKEWALTNNETPPTYSLRSQSGPAHSRTFVLECQLGDHVISGEGKSKKLAKNIAAFRMLEHLGIEM